jgi:RNA polymerase sigma-70 factor (ECF subfamily)
VSDDGIRRGDATAFERLFRAHYEPLCRFAARYVDDGAAAEELVQDLFTQIWVDRARWPEPANVRAYLFTAVRNRALNLGARRRIESDWVAAESATIPTTIHAVGDEEPSRIQSDESRSLLERSFGALPERCRLVMHLRWRDQLSYAEIAQVMGISVKGVEVQLSRGLRALRAAFGVVPPPK